MTMKAWDSEYALRGRLWGGRLRGLPTLPEGTSVLELGCGDGNTISAMPRGWKTTALDTSLSALHLCNRSTPNLDLILADATKLHSERRLLRPSLPTISLATSSERDVWLWLARQRGFSFPVEGFFPGVWKRGHCAWAKAR